MNGYSIYTLDEVGLSRLVSDFYSYAVTPDGTPGVPLGSHVNPHTAGGASGRVSQ